MSDTTICECEFCLEAPAHNVHMECQEWAVCALCGHPWMCQGAVEQLEVDDPDVDCRFCLDARTIVLPQGRQRSEVVPCPWCGEEDDPYGNGPFGDL